MRDVISLTRMTSFSQFGSCQCLLKRAIIRHSLINVAAGVDMRRRFIIAKGGNVLAQRGISQEFLSLRFSLEFSMYVLIFRFGNYLDG